MTDGYTKLLDVNLSEEKFKFLTPEESVLRKYIGGAGLAAKILWDSTTSTTPPLSEESPLIINVGPLSGLLVSSSRYVVSGISPLSGVWGQAHSGGDWAYNLRHAGYDGLIVRGKAEKPVYIWMNEDGVEIRDASAVWGLDTYESSDLLLKETDEKASVLNIGQAGERLVNVACVMNDGIDGRAAARCGLGALMGSKKLKAVVTQGSSKIPMHDAENFRKFAKELHSRFAPYPISSKPTEKERIEFYTKSFKGLVNRGSPIKNWTKGAFDPMYDLIEEALKDNSIYYCRGCPFSCSESTVTPDGERHMVWEHMAPLGTNCLIDDRESLEEAYSICNKYGMDSISVGNVVAFAMELMEKGIITPEHTGGIDLTWGNGEAALEMVKQIGEKKGFGEFLGQGVKIMAEKLGGFTAEYALHIKGLDFAAHDPRSTFSLALHYATCNLGASHFAEGGGLVYALDDYEKGFYSLNEIPELGYTQKVSRFQEEGKGEYVAKLQNFGSIFDSTSLCANVHRGRVQPSEYAQLVNYVTGWDIDKDELLQIGERTFNLKRMFNVRRGISRKDDFLPMRFLTSTRGEGESPDSIPHLGLMLKEYYAYRGWSEEGIPTREKLRELGLEECLEYSIDENGRIGGIG